MKTAPMNWMTKILISLMYGLVFLDGIPTTEAGPLQSCAKMLRDRLAAQDLIPMRLGSERQGLQSLVAKEWFVDDPVASTSKILEEYRGLLDKKYWDWVGDHGSQLARPANLRGEVITSLTAQKLTDGSFRVFSVSGKIMQMSIEYDQDQKMRFRLRILQENGTRTSVYLKDLHGIAVLKSTFRSRWQKIAQKVKTTFESFAESVLEWRREVILYGPLRIIFPDEDPSSSSTFVHGGFARIEGRKGLPWYSWVHPITTSSVLFDSYIYHSKKVEEDQFIVFTPKNGLVSLWNSLGNLIKKKTGQAVVAVKGDFKSPDRKRFYERTGRFSPLFINTPLFFVGFMLAYNHIEQNWWLEKIANRAIHIVQSEAQSIAEKSFHDPLLNRVERKWSLEEISTETAAEEVFLRYRATDEWPVIWRLHENETPENRVHAILNDAHLAVLLPATKHLYSIGPVVHEGIDVPDFQAEPASIEEADSLLTFNNYLLIQRELLSEFLKPGETLKEMLSDEDGFGFQEQYLELISDPYIEALIVLYRSGYLSEPQARYLLLESVRIKEKFLRWGLFEAVRYEIDENGERIELTEEAIRLKRIRDLEVNSTEFDHLLSVDFYPHMSDEFFSHKDLMADRNRTAAYLLAVRGAKPVVQRVVQMAAKGRYKNVARVNAAQGEFILTTSNEVHLAGYRRSLVKFGLNSFGVGLIAWDVNEHIDQWQEVDDLIHQAGQDPFLFEAAKHKVSENAEKLFSFLVDLGESYSGPASEQLLDRFEISGNPYLKAFADSNR